ncbi:velvet factor-domain-containing protein [Mycena filopes]|nr:velvet factor-domain-containing protein [Mycena filopes]
MQPCSSQISGLIAHTLSDQPAPPLQLQLPPSYCRQSVVLPANLVGLPTYFTEGRFAGRTLRAELEEIQRPEYGRRFGAIDKRVLDDAPVVLLRLFELLDAGTVAEREVGIQITEYADLPLAGMLCMAELFAVPDENLCHRAPTTQYATQDIPIGTTPHHRIPALDTNCSSIHESSNRTQSLFGAKFAEPLAVAFAGGQKHIIFAFHDLAVQLEGLFRLRYRFFDIFSTLGETTTVLAECYGQSFRIYSAKAAPALKESSTLTKRLANYGVRVNVRKTPRPRRRDRNGAMDETSE